MEGPAFAGLLSLSGRRSRRSYLALQGWFIACMIAFLYAAVQKDEDWAWELYLVVAAGIWALNTIALAQRLRDVGKPGAMALVMIVPVIGTTLILLFAFRAGQRGANQYGPDPLHDPLLGGDRR